MKGVPRPFSVGTYDVPVLFSWPIPHISGYKLKVVTRPINWRPLEETQDCEFRDCYEEGTFLT